MELDISYDVDCNVPSLGGVDPRDLNTLEQLIFDEVCDEQKFINIASILANFYMDVSLEFVEKWNRS